MSATVSFVIRPAKAAFAEPARGTSFLLVVKVSMGRHFHRTDRENSSIWRRQLAESYLTKRLFGQTLGRIEPRAWHPT